MGYYGSRSCDRGVGVGNDGAHLAAHRGTAIGIPLGLACLPLAHHAPLLLWLAAALAMIVYAMSLPERYDVASGAFAFTLVVTLAAMGEHSVDLLFSRAWETALGGAVGLLAALAILPLQPASETDPP